MQALMAGRDLSRAEANALMRQFTDPDVTDAWKAAALVALRIKGETALEVAGCAEAMREAAVPVHAPAAIDIVGTGGDGSDSFNVSTTTALVVAGAGVPVAKHGNRAVSSKCGSADVLEEIGISLAPDAPTAREQLQKAGFTFLFAPAFHPAMKAVVPVRRAIGVRTLFNELGPLTNPANPSAALIGAWSESVAERMAGALLELGVRAIVVHGALGWDEATPIGPFVRFTVGSDIRRDEVDPLTVYGLPRCSAADLAGGLPEENVEHTRDVLRGMRGARRDAVLLNAALALEVAGVASGRDAIAKAAEAIDSGAAAQVVRELGGQL